MWMLLAITPVCLQIAFLLDNLYVRFQANLIIQRANLLLENSVGYIPLSKDDPNYKLEAICKVEKGFSKGNCSNCEPESSDWIRANMRGVNIDNFDELMLDSPHPLNPLALIDPPTKRKPEECDWVLDGREKPLSENLESFLKQLIQHFKTLFDKNKQSAEYGPDFYFNIQQSREIA